MIKLLGLTVAAVLLVGAVESQGEVGWTQWFDRDDPSGTGDFEVLSNLRQENPGKICDNPLGIEAQTLSGLSVAQAGENIAVYDTVSGFACKNVDQPDKYCYDYKVRFSCPATLAQLLSKPPKCWTKYFNRDLPSGVGDFETLVDLRKENPNQICDNPVFIQVVTVNGNTPALNTGQKFLVYNPTDGFACRNSDQASGSCLDYKVRFACPCP